jgi:rhamnogalacturonyl hydrolase YesR
MKSNGIAGVILALFLFNTGYAQPEFAADSIKNMCKRVASGRLNSKLYNGWQVGTYFEGIMALYGLTQDKQYLDSTVAWGNYHNWLSAAAVPDTFAASYDDICCYQAYLETYLADPQPANLPHVQPALDYIERYTYQICPNKCGDVCWPIVDQYQMAAPSYPRTALILSDTTMYDSIYHFAVMNATHHYNVKFHLFNSNCSDTSVTRQWWGRGCGWGVGATCRIHQYLPPGHPGRTWCEQRIRETCAELITLQNQTDGMWRSELFTPSWNKEASGSGFFCYELFYALRNGILDTATYLGPAKKAWQGLIGCVGVDPAYPNLPGWSQGVGGGPSNNFGPTNHDEYTEGAFLLAGNEFYQLVKNGVSMAADDHSRPVPTPGKRSVTAVWTKNAMPIAPPQNVARIEVFTFQGRRLYAGRFDAKALLWATSGSNIVIVRYELK